MTFLGRLLPERRGIENPQVPLTNGNLLDTIGISLSTYSGESVTEGKVLGIPAVLRGAKIIAGTEAGLPLKVYKDSAALETVDGVPWMGVSPTTGQTWFERRETAALHKVLWGESFWLKIRSNGGQVVDAVPIHPGRVRVDPIPMGREKVKFSKVFVIDGEVPLTEWEIMHVPGASMNGVRGISAITALRQSLGIAIAAEKTAGTLYGRGMFHQGILSHDAAISAEEARVAKDRWRASVGNGSSTAGDIIVLGNSAKFDPITMPPGDAQFLESRNFSISEIARWLGLPGWMLLADSSTSRWGTGMEQEFTAWVTLSVKPEAQRDEQRITSELCRPGQVAEFKLEGLLRGDSAARASFYASGIQHGWLVPNDVRDLENMPHVAWGDEPYLPFNQSATGQANPSGGAA